MKKIRTLLFSCLLITTAFAQTDAEKEEAKRVILGEKRESDSKTNYPRDVRTDRDDRTVYGGERSRYPQRYPTTSGTSRERRVYEINRAYDAKIYSIRNNRTLSRSEKERIIRQLESERRRKLAQVNDSYYDNNKPYDNDDDYNDDKKSKKNKKDNGNHYGWNKGKGNPHKGKR